MPFSGELHARVADGPAVPGGLPLVVLLTGFTDAGSAVSGLIDHLHATTAPAPVTVFDNDLLLDYRARRPVVVFDQDHLTEYRPARLDLSLAHDALGQPFLLLSGYEPDFAWDAFADAVLDLIAEFEVSGVAWVHSIAMPVPHTRPLGTTVSGNRRDLVAAHSVWRPRTQVPSTAGHLLEYRIAERGIRVAGFVLLVPHYLADTDYPDTVLAAADKIMVATGLVLRTDEIAAARDEFRARVDEQVQGNDELVQMVHTLERRYDAYMSGRDAEDVGDGFDERDLPSADELAAELERYLATRRPGDEDKLG
ncbi:MULTISPECIES: proteasome assembly chaperone family protein [Microbacterium]|uniref:proteasome assembly chaperone family protein n=1 Tax=Microbacterium TaxID=33882 RepID=UPI00217F17A7|nr:MULTISPECIES: PAC2 family protein [Microbacterium]UWF78550.1 PAC2 family protein [Microbacterium neungamense]WCM54635.1 PAC2 family protein [Microbacterium sp. EF45047]